MADPDSLKWRAVSNLSSSDAWELEDGPWAYTNPEVPVHKTKAERRKWQVQEDTDHMFYTPFEGVNANVRIEQDNPPLLTRGWVADYDADVSLDDMERIIAGVPAGLRPTHICKTFSGGARAVWQFSHPVWVDCAEVAERFLKNFHTEVKAQKLAAGFDEASLKPAAVWEMGTDWREVKYSIPIPERTTRRIYMEAVRSTKAVKAVYESIPVQEIQAEIEEQYPGRLYGHEIELGARIPLFWLPKIGDGKEKDTSAIVSEWGVYSFSSRADKGCMFWDELLGSEFIRQYTEKRTDEVIADMYYDGHGYWRPDKKGEWIGANREDTVLHLKVAGNLSASKKPKDTASEAEHTLYAIQQTHRVDATSPFPHTTAQFVPWNGETYLNINRKRPIDPAAEGCGDPKKFPWIHKFFENFLEQHPMDKVHPKHHLLAELQRLYNSFITSKPTSGHINILVGETDKGKSLFNTGILRWMMGSATDAGNFLVGGKAFNKELGESAIWFIDDNKSTTSIAQHKNFSESLKKHAATPEVQHQPKYKDARAIPWFGRIFVSCNDDPDSVTLIPDLDIHIKDKLNLFRVNPKWQAEFLEIGEMEELIRKELPFFLRWLLDYEPPAEIMTPDKPRYGIKPYHHPGLEATARESSSQFRLSELLDIWREKAGEAHVGEEYWEGPATALLMSLMDPDYGLTLLVKSYTAVSFGKQLQGLLKIGECDYLEYLGTKNNRAIWRLRYPVPTIPVRQTTPEDDL